jgi:two-component system, OmpR family, sensor kinase
MQRLLKRFLFDLLVLSLLASFGLGLVSFLISGTSLNLVLSSDYHLRIELASLIFLLGLITGGLGGIVFLTIRWADDRVRKAQAAEQERGARQVQAARAEEQQLAEGRIQAAHAEEQQIAEHRVREARADEQRAKLIAQERFLDDLHHELKNPVNTLGLGVVNLQQTTLTSEQIIHLNHLAQQVKRLKRLTAGLGELTKLREGQLEKADVCLPELLAEARDTTPYLNRSISLNIQQTPWPLSSVAGDYTMLFTAFSNLLDNALKYSSEKDQVEVRATDDGQFVTIEIADTGCGIPSDEIPLIFEALYRAQNVREHQEGTGLGLALVKRIMDLHRGEIRVSSRLGMGAIFVVRLPVQPGE